MQYPSFDSYNYALLIYLEAFRGESAFEILNRNAVPERQSLLTLGVKALARFARKIIRTPKPSKSLPKNVAPLDSFRCQRKEIGEGPLCSCEASADAFCIIEQDRQAV